MKIKATNYIFHCQCGKQFVKELCKTFVKKVKGSTVNITETEIECPFCHQERMVKLIGTVEYFGNSDEYSVLHYTLKPVKVADKWEYKDINEQKASDFNNSSLTWTAKQEQWRLEEELTTSEEKD